MKIEFIVEGNEIMRSAAAIMHKKQFIKDELDRQLPRRQSDELWARAQEKLEEILKRYADIPTGEHMHTDQYIFPAAALYLTVKDAVNPQLAYSVIENASINKTTNSGAKLVKLMRIPFFRNLFVWIWDPMTKKMFGPAQGFKNTFYPKKKGEYRMDIVDCPYYRYFTQLGCPELTKIFCANDERIYGNLPGLEFIRTGTLGTGANCCDFTIRKV